MAEETRIGEPIAVHHTHLIIKIIQLQICVKPLKINTSYGIRYVCSVLYEFCVLFGSDSHIIMQTNEETRWERNKIKLKMPSKPQPELYFQIGPNVSNTCTGQCTIFNFFKFFCLAIFFEIKSLLPFCRQLYNSRHSIRTDKKKKQNI